MRCEWATSPAARASRRKRRAESLAAEAFMTFSATSCPSDSRTRPEDLPHAALAEQCLKPVGTKLDAFAETGAFGVDAGPHLRTAYPWPEGDPAEG